MDLKILVPILLLFAKTNSLQLVSDNVNLDLTVGENGWTQLSLTLDGEEKISGHIGRAAELQLTEDCEGANECTLSSALGPLNIVGTEGSFILEWTAGTDAVLQDCLDLKIGEVNWFGGPQKFEQEWPVENTLFENRLYTSLKSDNGAVSERYWLNSKGGYVFVDDRVPLFVDQNNPEAGSICFSAKLENPYVGRDKVLLRYALVARNDAREAQLHAVKKFLGSPTEHPDEWIIRNPIWTTWAKYKKAINDDTVVAFAQDIADHGFTGQIEIDDYWETCYGSLVFNDEQFANINDTVQSLKDLGFTVTLWTHPFVNHDCVGPMTIGQENGYFVKSVDGGDETSWWDGNPAHYVDFTNDEAANWWADRLRLLQELHGIDSFKFDAGESDYPPPNPVLSSGDVELSPGWITSSYVRTCATFGQLIEVRSAWRTQDLPIFVRMLDKDSRWGLNNGLQSLVTTLLQMNIVGYVYVLPDMIGGNGYSEQPTAELLARWTQANTFMPTMQFSYLPWELTSEEFDGVEIITKFVALHEEYADEILAAMNNSIATGTPVNPPIWWVDPTNEDALAVNDEYLLGENILVAPVLELGATSRNIVLPSGTWKDGNDGTIYEGPQILTDFPAPIDVLPWFIKQ